MAWIYPEFSDQTLIDMLRLLLRDNVDIHIDHEDIYRIVIKGMTDNGMLTWSHNPDVIGGDVELFAVDVASRVTNEFKR
jgi:hypothetical protein